MTELFDSLTDFFHERFLCSLQFAVGAAQLGKADQPGTFKSKWLRMVVWLQSNLTKLRSHGPSERSAWFLHVNLIH